MSPRPARVWVGKIVGGVLGVLIAGVPGAIGGLLIGHWFDRGLRREAQRLWAGQRRRRAFVEAAFRTLGCIAKADGRVSSAEIRCAETSMEHLRLTRRERRQAMRDFYAGKQAAEVPRAALQAFMRTCGEAAARRSLAALQIEMALVDAPPSPRQRRLLAEVFGLLRLPRAELELLLGRGAGAGARAPSRPAPDRLAGAYRELGVSADSSAAELRHAYRRLMSQHHPDKLAARGLSGAELQAATARAQRIGAAWRTIRELRQL